jgi:ribosomal protein S18 acetylase RimI-like enzyme
MPWFEDFNPQKSESRPLPEDFHVRLVQTSDAEVIARLRAEREEREYESLIDEVNTLLKEFREIKTTQVFVAVGDGAVIGFAIMRYFTPADDAPSNSAPEGWYLLGINVKREYRRRGIGTELIIARLKFIPNEYKKAYFFTNTKNFTS